MSLKSVTRVSLGVMLISVMSCHRSEFDFTATQYFGDIDITVGLESVSVFAEYKKFAIVTPVGRPPTRHELFMDTGGYSAVSVSESDSCLFIVTPHGNDVLEIDKATGSVRKLSLSDIPVAVRPVGEFNFDAKDRSIYRYFPVNK